MSEPRLTLVGLVDWERRPPDWRERARTAAPALDFLILRAKAQAAADQLTWARDLRGLDCPLLVADRMDVALAAEAAGVHLPERGLPAVEVRRLWPTAVITRSIHHPPEAAEEDGVDWLIFGHLFATRSKPGLAPRGLEEAARVVGRATRPVLGIGGVTPATAGLAAATGLAGLVAADGIWGAADPAAAARAIRAAWSRGKG